MERKVRSCNLSDIHWSIFLNIIPATLPNSELGVNVDGKEMSEIAAAPEILEGANHTAF